MMLNTAARDIRLKGGYYTDEAYTTLTNREVEFVIYQV